MKQASLLHTPHQTVWRNGRSGWGLKGKKEKEENDRHKRAGTKSGEDGSMASSGRGITARFEKDTTWADFFDIHLPQEWSAALIW